MNQVTEKDAEAYLLHTFHMTLGLEGEDLGGFERWSLDYIGETELGQSFLATSSEDAYGNRIYGRITVFRYLDEHNVYEDWSFLSHRYEDLQALEVLALAVKSTGKIWTQKPAVRLWL